MIIMHAKNDCDVITNNYNVILIPKNLFFLSVKVGRQKGSWGQVCKHKNFY